MASNQKLCELFRDFRKTLGDFIGQSDKLEINFEFDLPVEFFREDLDKMKEQIHRMRECLETINEELE